MATLKAYENHQNELIPQLKQKLKKSENDYQEIKMEYEEHFGTLNDTIEDLRFKVDQMETELHAVKSENNTLRSQNDRLKEDSNPFSVNVESQHQDNINDDTYDKVTLQLENQSQAKKIEE